MNGFLVVDKPTGWTSHDVVAKVRNAAGRLKVGHAGTLDPMAMGVLVLCLGNATRLAEWATGADKQYHAEVTLGAETITYDATGEVLVSCSVAVSRSKLQLALGRFRGEISQRPPAYSAVQIGGQRAYDIARRGGAVELPPREVTIHELNLLAYDPPVATLDITCSKGTYVRSLAHDLGQALGCGAHLSALRRLRSGAFTLEQAVKLEDVVTAMRERRGGALLRPLALAVADLPALHPGAEGIRELRFGRPWVGPSAAGAIARAHEDDGALAAIVEWRNGVWWPSKVLAS